MPKQTSKSSLAARLGQAARAVFDEKKAEAPTFGAGGDLPSGIDGGVAQLVECKFDLFKEGPNKGEYFFYAAGVVKSPAEHDGQRIEGLRTSIMEPVCDTPSRGSRPAAADHVAWVQNELKKLGADLSESTVDDLEQLVADLKEQAPHFRFRTWVGSKQEVEERDGKFFVGAKGPYKTKAAALAANPFVGREPRVQHEWRGVCEYVDEGGDDVVDETQESPAPKKPGGLKKPGKPAPEPEDEPTLAELAEAADAKPSDEEAATKIAEAAEAAGVDPEQFSSWAEVVTAIEEAASPEAETEEAAEEAAEETPWEPVKGDVYKFKPKGARKPVECEVTAVFAAKQLVNLKNLDDGKTAYKGIAWDGLIQE